MKCPICEKDVELQKKQVGVDEQGAPIFHQYAVCRDCKKQWDLDKQRARKAASAQKADAASAGKPDQGKPVQKADTASAGRPVQKADTASAGRPVQKADTVSAGKPVQKADTVSAGKPIQKANASSIGKPALKQDAAASSKPAEEQKTVQKTMEAGSVPAGKAKPKPAPSEGPAEKKMNRKPASSDRASEKKGLQKPAHSQGAGEKKTGQKPVPGSSSAEKNKRIVSEEQAADAGKKARRRLPSAESVSNKEGNRKAPLQEQSGERGNVHRAAPLGSASRAASGHSSSDRGTSEKPASGNAPAKKPGAERPSSGKEAAKRERPSSGTGNREAAGQPRRAAVKKSSVESEERRYGNIPPDKVRAKKEHAVRKGYEDMLSTDPNYKPPKKKRPDSGTDHTTYPNNRRTDPAKGRPHTKAEIEDDYEDEDMEYEEVKARFRIPRIIFGIISIVAAGFFAYGGFFTGLDGIAAGGTASKGTAFIVYGICMLVSGLILIILQNRNTIFAFILPMLAYFGGAAFTFLNRKEDAMLLYCSVVGAVLGIIFLILGIISRNSGYDDSEDYDDPFEDDYE